MAALAIVTMSNPLTETPITVVPFGMARNIIQLPARSSGPMLPDPASLYQPGNPLALIPYTSSVNPNLSSPRNLSSLHGKSTGEEDPEWTEKKRRLEGRFNSTRPRYDPVGHIAPSTALVPDTGPLQHNWGQEHVVPPAIHVPHREPPPVDMHSFAIWIGDHAVDHQKHFRITDLTERVRHNISDFAKSLESYSARRQTASRGQWGPPWTNDMEEVYQRGRQVEALYQTTVAKYDGPFKRKRECSKSEKAEAQKLLKSMFGRDYDLWDGLNWHVNHWISHFHRLSS
ncbi:hypothetical protein F4679DRAFT_578031 [Xylaria curta]|nr:hypothetical protein F4679DRAFT_578031 [Xylaria curta]